MSSDAKPIAKAQIRLREESDSWVILFDPDTGSARVLNPMGVFVWKRLDGDHSVRNIVDQIRQSYSGVAEEVEQQVTQFIEVLEKKGFVQTNGKGMIE
jgi:SynChlorMet cassette protein ScmD